MTRNAIPIEIPDSNHYIIHNAGIPVGCWEEDGQGVGDKSSKERQGVGTLSDTPVSVDSIATVDIEVKNGEVLGIYGSGPTLPSYVSKLSALRKKQVRVLDLRGKFLLPTFVDLHTHIDKGHTAERSRNPTGNLSGADKSTAADAAFWDSDDVERRMEFSIRCAYAHGTSALRTHLINMTPKHIELTWPAFSKLREKWRGKVELQGVSLVALSFYRDLDAATRLADVVAQHGGLLGAAVCCAEQGGSKDDDWTTCDRDRDVLLDRIFILAKERNLSIDFHTDENGNELARGLRYVAEKTLQHGYEGRVVCGHCCSLAYQPQKELAKTLQAAAKARITIVSLPLVNQWTQDRHARGGRTPRWRGITLMHESRHAGVPVAIASDNTRDQFYAYGDLDMLEVFNQGCRMAHLDRPYGNWIQSVTSVPANAMDLPGHGRLKKGNKANFIIFPTARKYSELLSRPQTDRLVVRNGRLIDTTLPSYEELDYIPQAVRSGEVPVTEVKYDPISGAVIWKANIGVAPSPEADAKGALVQHVEKGSPVYHQLSTGRILAAISFMEWIAFFLMSTMILRVTASI